MVLNLFGQWARYPVHLQTRSSWWPQSSPQSRCDGARPAVQGEEGMAQSLPYHVGVMWAWPSPAGRMGHGPSPSWSCRKKGPDPVPILHAGVGNLEAGEGSSIATATLLTNCPTCGLDTMAPQAGLACGPKAKHPWSKESMGRWQQFMQRWDVSLWVHHVANVCCILKSGRHSGGWMGADFLNIMKSSGRHLNKNASNHRSEVRTAVHSYYGSWGHPYLINVQ